MTIVISDLYEILFDSESNSVRLGDVDESWTLSELVAQATSRNAALPPPKNGQVRPVPDERTIRYYAAIGLVDRPVAMRGRTALYGARHLAQVVAIKRLQGAGRSLAEIRALWPSLDDATLSRMSGVELAPRPRGSRKEFWKGGATHADAAVPPWPVPPRPIAPPAPAPVAQPAAVAPVELRLELAAHVSLILGISADASLALTPADVRALRAAAASLVTELANRGLIAHGLGTLEES